MHGEACTGTKHARGQGQSCSAQRLLFVTWLLRCVLATAKWFCRVPVIGSPIGLSGPRAEGVTCLRLPPAPQISLAAVHQRRSIKDVLSSCGPSCRQGRTTPPVGRVVRSDVFFLLKKKEHCDHTTRHCLGVERLPKVEKTHRDQNEDCDASLMNYGHETCEAGDCVSLSAECRRAELEFSPLHLDAVKHESLPRSHHAC